MRSGRATAMEELLQPCEKESRETRRQQRQLERPEGQRRDGGRSLPGQPNRYMRSWRDVFRLDYDTKECFLRKYNWVRYCGLAEFSLGLFASLRNRLASCVAAGCDFPSLPAELACFHCWIVGTVLDSPPRRQPVFVSSRAQAELDLLI